MTTITCSNRGTCWDSAAPWPAATTASRATAAIAAAVRFRIILWACRNVPRALLSVGYARVADSVRGMKQAVSLITLGVSDYARAKSFYESLGWTVALDIEETAFFRANSVVVVLWGRDKLAADSGIDDDGASWGGIALAHNVASREEVDQVIEQARASGATVTRQPAETFYGGSA